MSPSTPSKVYPEPANIETALPMIVDESGRQNETRKPEMVADQLQAAASTWNLFEWVRKALVVTDDCDTEDTIHLKVAVTCIASATTVAALCFSILLGPILQQGVFLWAIPLAYILLIGIGYVGLLITAAYGAFMHYMFGLLFALPLLLHLQMGGFSPSGGMVVWSVLTPILSGFFQSITGSFVW